MPSTIFPLYQKFYFNIADFPLRVLRSDYEHNQQRVIEHCHHDFCELIIIIRGHGIHVVGDVQQEIFPGNVFLMHPGSSHSLNFSKDFMHYNVLFDLSLLRQIQLDLSEIATYQSLFQIPIEVQNTQTIQNIAPSIMCLPEVALSEIENTLLTLEKEFELKQSGYKAMLFSSFIKLLTLISRLAQPIHLHFNHSSFCISRSVSYIIKNYTENLSLEVLAQQVEMSVHSYRILFQRIMGESPLQYIIRLRIENSYKILINSDQSITKIAFRTGFNDSNYFSRKFKQQTGLTPNQYRLKFRPE